MANVVKFESSAHWYACKGANPEPQHDADLRVARKAGLYPSITTVLKDEFKNDFLDRWKTNELLLAAASTYKQPHESEYQYCQRIYDISQEKAKTAAEFGKAVHDAIEHYPQSACNDAIRPWVEKFGEWYDANVEHADHREKILFDHSIGLAGRCDFIGRGKRALQDKSIVPDWKTQNVKKDKDTGKKKPVFYESWPRQLAFYARCHQLESGLVEMPTCISVIIDSNEPDIFVKVWEKEEIFSAYEDVVIAAYRWFKKRNYWPQPYGRFGITPSIQMPNTGV